MYNEGTPEFVVDQGLYYPSATSYGYYCTGFEAPGNWEDHNRVFGLDGPEFQYAGAQSENLPYVYYTPSYGYTQSPYNPYMPGSVIGVDGPALGSQQYYSVPLYQNPSLPNYAPFAVQPDIIPNISPDSWLDTSRSVTNKPDGRGLKPNVPSGSVAYHKNQPRSVSNQTNSITKVPEVPKGSSGLTKQQVGLGSISSGSVPSHLIEGKLAVDKLQSRNPVGGALNELKSNPDALGEQNRGPRINRSKTQLVVKAYTTKAGDCDEQGNIIIHTDLYNKDDFPVEYANAKFFVIKSYSEDDVHKSIKYNFWSSTPHGNKKLNSAYEDAQKLAAGDTRGCPIFLFFSVNASGQFCGVAEMTGPVNFQMDMDFWQQDKWSGSFPVKWHFIKDVPNIYFRHIILENNENKPVTNSRDTQEIMFNQGLEMLKIFKSHPLKTSIFDDFMYYENRQRIMQEQKAKLLIKSLETPFFVPAVEPPRKIVFPVDPPSIVNRDDAKNNDPQQLDTGTSDSEKVSSNSDVGSATKVTEKVEKVSSEPKDDISSIKIGSLTINPKPTGSKPLDADGTGSKHAETVNVASVPVKVNGSAGASGILTVGTIPLNPKALRFDKRGSAK